MSGGDGRGDDAERDADGENDAGRDPAGEAGHAGDGYAHRPLSAFETNPEKPGRRWELSPAFGIEGFNFNVAVLAPGERLSQNAYHYHENHTEFFYVVEGHCRVEVEDGSFDCGEDEVVLFKEGVVHLLHNPFEEPCKVVAVGHPPEGRHPVERVEGFDELLEERYGDGTGREAGADATGGSGDDVA